MLKINSLLFVLIMLFLTACGDGSSDTDERKQNSNKKGLTTEKVGLESPLIISWDDLVPANYQPEEIVAKYQKQLDKFEEEDYSSEAVALYSKINAELNNAPENKTLNNKQIKLPGFIAPLNQHNGVITEFLLVPYFGACIHAPPPPINQTVLVKVADNMGIKIDDSYNAFWVSGEIRIDGKKTDIGEAGYRIENATIETYVE